MSMHVPTMFLMVILVSLTMACCTAALWRRSNPEGLGYWALGLTLHGVSFILVSLRGALPYGLTVVLANLLLLSGFSLFCQALLQFQRRHLAVIWLWWPVPAALPGLLMLPDNTAGRIVLIALLCTYQAALMLFITLGRRHQTTGRGQYFVMSAAALGILTMGVRALTTALAADQVQSLTSSTPVQAATFLISCVVLILSSMGLILMTKERSDACNRSLAMHDELTGLPNRRYSMEVLARVVAARQRHPQHLSLMMLDIDHFKQINDQYGHLAGDQALRRLADQLRARLRLQDHVGRLGGEEFLVILPDTPAQGALRLAEDLRRSVEQLHGQRADSAAEDLGMTISIGVCSLTPADALDALAAIELADQALYLAKQNGRNRVQLTGAGGLSTSDPAPLAPAQPGHAEPDAGAAAS